MSTTRQPALTSNPTAELFTGAASITIHYAEDLPHPGGLGRRDTYCLLMMGGQCLRTRTAVDGGCNPMWNETISALLTAEDTIEIVIKDDDPASQQPDIGVCSISLSQALRARGRSCGGKPQRLTVPVMAPCGARGGGDGEGGSEDDRGGEGGGGGVRRGYLAVTVVWEPCGAQHEAEGDGSTHEVAATAAAAAATGVLAAASAAGAADVLSAHHTALQSVQHAVTTELEDTAAEAPSAAVQEAETDLSLQSDSSAAQRAPSWARQRSKARYPQIFPYAYPPWPPTCSAAHGSALSDEPHDGPLPLRPGPGPAATATMRHLRTSSSSRRGAALRARDALRVGLWKRGGGGEGEASACLLVRARTA